MKTLLHTYFLGFSGSNVTSPRIDPRASLFVICVLIVALIALEYKSYLKK